MNRALCFSLFLLSVAGCQLPPEVAAVKPLAEDGPPQPYVELVSRARSQAKAANEAFYINRWSDLEDAARGLEQTARFLGKATDIPARHKDTLAVEAGDLGKEAAALRDGAKTQNIKQVTDSMQKLNLKVRELRPEN